MQFIFTYQTFADVELVIDAEAEALECMTDVTAMILEKLGQTLVECQKRRDLHLESSCQVHMIS